MQGQYTYARQPGECSICPAEKVSHDMILAKYLPLVVPGEPQDGADS